MRSVAGNAVIRSMASLMSSPPSGARRLLFLEAVGGRRRGARKIGDLLAQRRRHVDLDGVERIPELVGVARADDRRGHGGMRAHPGDRRADRMQAALLAEGDVLLGD